MKEVDDDGRSKREPVPPGPAPQPNPLPDPMPASPQPIPPPAVEARQVANPMAADRKRGDHQADGQAPRHQAQ